MNSFIRLFKYCKYSVLCLINFYNTCKFSIFYYCDAFICNLFSSCSSNLSAFLQFSCIPLVFSDFAIEYYYFLYAYMYNILVCNMQNSFSFHSVLCLLQYLVILYL